MDPHGYREYVALPVDVFRSIGKQPTRDVRGLFDGFHHTAYVLWTNDLGAGHT